MDNDYVILLRLLLAVVLGGLIGAERELMNRAAGLRTHVMVSLGSALFTILSFYAFYQEGRVNDPARIAAQVVSGIGFLGAGTIMKHGATVKGLTTAATLWVVAAIGMACGAGYYQAAIISGVVSLLTLIFMRGVERRISGDTNQRLSLRVPDKPGVIQRVYGVFEVLGVRVTTIVFEEAEDEAVDMELSVIIPQPLSITVISQALSEVGATHLEIIT